METQGSKMFFSRAWRGVPYPAIHDNSTAYCSLRGFILEHSQPVGAGALQKRRVGHEGFSRKSHFTEDAEEGTLSGTDEACYCEAVLSKEISSQRSR